MEAWHIIIITLLFSALFSGMEIAFISANKLLIELGKNRGMLSARILSRFSNSPSKFIGALLLGNNISLVIYGIAMARILESPIAEMFPKDFQSDFLIVLTQTILSTLLILLVAEFIPKALFRINPNAVVNLLALPLSIVYVLLYPIVYVFIGISVFILKKIFRVHFTEDPYVFSPIDFEHYIDQFGSKDNEEGEMKQEIQMFHNVIELRDVKLRECMVPRTEIEALEINDSMQKLRNKFIETGYSRILIYSDSIDNITGYIHAYDLFGNPKSIRSVFKPIPILPETMLANNALKIFIQDQKNIAVIVDEFGGTSGIVTMEDIIEEIFGEIEDEYDVEDLIEKQTAPNEYIFSGRIEIDYINEKYNLNIPVSDEYETLAGFIIHHHKSIPDLKEEIAIDNYLFYIIQASENRIEKVHLKVI